MSRAHAVPPDQNLEHEMAVNSAGPKGTPEATLRQLIERSDAKHHKLIRAVRTAVRKRLPAANELLYDYKKFFVISYSPTENGIESVVAIAARPDGIRLYLMNGPELPDPKKLLLGSGKQARYIPVEAASRLAHPDVKALIAAAIGHAGVPLPSRGRGKLVIKSAANKKPAPRRAAPRKRAK
jgi:hypothetical protein